MMTMTTQAFRCRPIQFFAMAAVLAFTLAPPVLAKAEAVPKFVVELMVYTVSAGDTAQFIKARTAMFAYLERRDGFIAAESRRDPKDPSVVVDISIWATEADHTAAGAAMPQAIRNAFMENVSEWKYFGVIH